MLSSRVRTALRVLVPGLLCVCLIAPAHAQYFGRNKVRYNDFKFEVFQTEHFDIYFYPEESDAIPYAARMAERWHAGFTKILDHDLRGRQPLILYASHPHFEQTNAIPGLLSESTGGVTEAFKRRIVLPFGGSLHDTDHVIGHEIVHAFQYDITDVGGASLGSGALSLPLWFIEGMAEYLSVGPMDSHTAMWIRDAARRDKLPDMSQLSDPRFFPYRYGHAFLSYIAGHHGDDIIGKILKASTQGDIKRAITKAVGVHADSLINEWHAAVHEQYDPLLETTQEPTAIGKVLLSKKTGSGELNIAPALSPDGNRIIFFSEKDLFTINLFVADANTGEILQTIIKAERDPHLESLQFINSAGAWDADGRRVAFASVVHGRPALGILDVDQQKIVREERFDDLGEILNPTWSPEGNAVAFAALAGGVTDLFVYDLEDGLLRRLTDDAFTDIQPAWSPDGSRIAFTTDRFTADLDNIDNGHLEIAMIDPLAGDIERVAAFETGKHVNPAWAPDGGNLYFVSDATGISNIYRVDVDSGELFRVTNFYTGVSGITAISPTLTSALQRERIAFCVYEEGRYNIYTIDEPTVLAGEPVTDEAMAAAVNGARGVQAPKREDMPRVTLRPGLPAIPQPPREAAREVVVTTPAWLPPVKRESDAVRGVIRGRPRDAAKIRPIIGKYKTRFSLDYIGQPYLAGGADRFGANLGGGMSLFFSDMLGNQKLATAIQVQSNGTFTDIGGAVGYENDSRRWTWGGALQQLPIVFDQFAVGFDDLNGRSVFVEQTRSIRQTTRSGTGFVAYPFNRSKRVEFGLGYQNITFDDKLRTIAFDEFTGELVQDETVDLGSSAALNLAFANVALVHDFSFYGATSPILGERYRFEVSPVFGSLQYATALADYRRYFLFRPFTLAFRGLHFGRYGSDSDTNRLAELFVGYQSFVRGYDSGSFSAAECEPTASDPCPVFNQLFGSRMAVTNAELRFPLLRVLGLGSGYYGILPLETGVFFDAGAAWTGSDEASFLGGNRDIVKSVGATIRLGLSRFAVLQLDFVNPLDRPNKDWFWQFSVTPGF